MNASTQTAAAPGAIEVIRLVRAQSSVLDIESVPLNDAAGRVLREAVCAPEDQPPFDRSSFDGYAVRADDPGPEFQVVDSLRAGQWKPRPLKSGEAVRIATGGALPGEGLQVVMKEDVEVKADRLRVLRRETEPNIRFRGEAARRGQVLIESGTILRPGTLALLASLGQTQPRVTRRPHVVHVATGNEIIAPEQLPEPGQIRDSNSTLVRAFCRQFGIQPRQHRAPEDQTAALNLLQAVKDEIEAVDVLLISGGASVGPHDFTRALFEQLGYQVHLAKTNTRPGKPLIFASRGHSLAFGLPGNPLAHFVGLNLYVRAALEKMAGRPDRELFQPAVLTVQLDADANGRESLWPAEAGWRDGRLEATPLRWSSSGDLTALARANALLQVPPHTGTLASGATVPAALTELAQ